MCVYMEPNITARTQIYMEQNCATTMVYRLKLSRSRTFKITGMAKENWNMRDGPES